MRKNVKLITWIVVVVKNCKWGRLIELSELEFMNINEILNLN